MVSLRKIRNLSFFWIQCLTTVFPCAGLQALAQVPVSHKPVFQLDLANPTADKPQSKLWFARGSWWAWLPNREGSSVWRRTSSGWRRAEGLDESLRGLPGRADVWREGDTVGAVLVDGRRLAVVTLRYIENENGYVLLGRPTRFELREAGRNDVIETATIARDGCGGWWIAYPWQRQMWVQTTLNAEKGEWTEPFAVSGNTDADDLCAIVALPGGIGLAWSNQANDTTNFRLHKDGADAKTWEPTEEIERGNRNADDHINAKVSPDGTLLLATKNSVDRVGDVQLVLRVRHPNGRWEKRPYARRTPTALPSRPMVLLGGTPPELLLVHTQYGPGDDRQVDGRRNTIVWQAAPLGHVNAAAVATPSEPLIDPAGAVNNVTGCKAPFPTGYPWIVLASDAVGHVYEGRIDSTRNRAASAASPAQ